MRDRAALAKMEIARLGDSELGAEEEVLAWSLEYDETEEKQREIEKEKVSEELKKYR